MNVYWMQSSRNDLQSIDEYIAQNDPLAAKRVVQAIVAAGNTLAELPHRARSGRVQNTYEMVLTKLPYTIAYRIKNGRVEILRVIHQARLWPDML